MKLIREENSGNLFVIVGLAALTYFLFKIDLSEIGFFSLIYLIFMILHQVVLYFTPDNPK